MKTLSFAGVTAVILAVGVTAAVSYPEGRITIKVLSDESVPVETADVGIGFQVLSSKYFGNEEIEVRGLSNANGEFSGSAKADKGVGFTIRKAGYYETTGKYNFKEAVADKWQPWNPTLEVVLRRIGTPVPMYARQLRVEIPVVDEPVGFDLVVSDWVAPHGKGATADFVLVLNRKWIDQKDFDARLRLTFSDPGDGIQAVEEPLLYGSELKLPRTAPEEGYEPQFVTSISRVPGKAIQNEARDNRSHFYRVRTLFDEKGRVVSALYGKLRGDIRLDPINSKTAAISFIYYLNPDGTRNLEFDPKQNLYNGLDVNERVKEP